MVKLKKSRFFWLFYTVFTLCLIVLASGVLLYVHALLVEYETSQPDHIIRQITKEMEAAAKDGTLWEYTPRPEEVRSRFDTAGSTWDAYEQKLAAGELTFAKQSGVFSEDSLSYVILLGEEAVASVKIQSTNTRTKLFVFTFSDWSLVSITPYSTSYSYSCEFHLPKDFSATVNGLPLASTEFVRAEDDINVYLVENLAAAPSIAVYDPYGTEAAYDIKDGVLTPVTHRSEISLPEGLTVTLGGKTILPVFTEAGYAHYVTLTAAQTEIVISDAFGGSVVYSAGMNLTAGMKTVTLPSTFSLSVGSVLLTAANGVSSPNPNYPADLPGAEVLPQLTTYSFLILDTTPVSVIYPDGTSVLLETVDGTEIRDVPVSEGTPPIDVLPIAEMWSLFMTDDLGGKDNGFSQIAGVLLKDSYLYDHAYRWSTGVDITFTSIHTLKNPAFGKESVTDYRRFSDNLFSCRVYLEKYMRLNSGQNVTDTMHSTLWFVLTDEGWKLAAMQEITEDLT